MFSAEVVLLDKFVVVYKVSGDAFFYVLANADESELVVANVLSCLEETMSNLLRCVGFAVLFAWLPDRLPFFALFVAACWGKRRSTTTWTSCCLRSTKFATTGERLCAARHRRFSSLMSARVHCCATMPSPVLASRLGRCFAARAA